MTAIKESSSRNANKQMSIGSCPVTYAMQKIGGHWKPVILYHLIKGAKRYSEIRRAIPDITEKVLGQQLKQLQEDGLIIRKAEPVVPPHVTYSLSPSGVLMAPMMDAMVMWALQDIALKQGKSTRIKKMTVSQ